MAETVTTSAEETQALAVRVVRALAGVPGVRGTATILALEGNLGAGKTTFTKGLASALGLRETVTSPTFVLEKVYELPEGTAWKRLVHIDAYRLESEEELGALGWHEAATDPGNLIVIEWPEQVGRGVPERAYTIRFEHVNETERKIVLDERLSVNV